nr:MAG TPA: hypothetical protein [Caudoviricetes sp.]
MKITEYARTTKVSDNDVLLIDGTTGTKTVSIEQLKYSLFENNPVMHRNIWRNNNLGSVVSAQQYQAISSGKFNDIYVGDYWTINGIKWQVVDLDYFYKGGDSSFIRHHAVIMPTKSIGFSSYEDTRSNSNGYFNSKLYKSSLSTVRNTINNTFSGHVIEHKEGGTYERDGAGAFNCRSENTTISLASTCYVYGDVFFSPLTANGQYPIVYNGQFAAFRMNGPEMLTGDDGIAWWLRDPVSTSGFACVTENLLVNWGWSEGTKGLRPYFLIG